MKPFVTLIEDNPDSRLLITLILEQWFDVEAFEDGPRGLEGMQARLPHCAVLDISLPGMSGIEILQAMRNNPALAGIPAVALTAHAMSGDRERLLAAGFNAYVLKPILDPDALQHVIDDLINA